MTERIPRPLLEVDDLHVRFETGRETVRAVGGLSLSVDTGELVGLVGESGCGKSAAIRAIAGLHDHAEHAHVEGSVQFDGIDVLEATPEARRRLRATRLSTVFQDPSATLTPTRSVVDHLLEALRLADRPGDRSLRAGFGLDPRDWGQPRRDRRTEATDLLASVDLDSAVLERYPHELSGGQAQRVSLAIALASDPDLLLADEPTTALDATTQVELLEHLERLVADRELGVVLVSHDLGLIADVCDRVVVSYAGQVMEAGPAARVLDSPRHPYTRALLGCRLEAVDSGERLPTISGTLPDPTLAVAGCPFESRCSYASDECRTIQPPTIEVGETNGVVRCGELETVPDSSVVDAISDSSVRTDHVAGTEGRSERESDLTNALELTDVTKRYPLEDSWLARVTGRDRWHTAVEDVSLSVRRGETLGLVGESGAGKSTVIDLVTGLEEPTSGTVRIDGDVVGSVAERSSAQLAAVGRLFQHPRASLDPRQPVRAAITEPLLEAGWSSESRQERLSEVLSLVGLEDRHAQRRPGQLSGGQCQRVALGRAIALEPALVVLDEPTSALDVSVRARICNLLIDLQDRLGSAFVVVSHDLGVVSHLADRIAVMADGRLLECGPAERICTEPTHEYTERLLDASGLDSGGSNPAGRLDDSDRRIDREPDCGVPRHSR